VTLESATHSSSPGQDLSSSPGQVQAVQQQVPQTIQPVQQAVQQAAQQTIPQTVQTVQHAIHIPALTRALGLVVSCLSPTPEQRPTAHQLHQELAALLQLLNTSGAPCYAALR
jgi:hypothetical protein